MRKEPLIVPLEEVVHHIGKSIMHFDKDTRFVSYSGRAYPNPDWPPVVRIGVFGSAYDSEQIRELDDRRLENLVEKKPKENIIKTASEIGKELARQGQPIVTGACGGLPYEVLKAAKKYDPNIFVIGISPASGEQAHREKGMPVELHDWVFYSGGLRNKLGYLMMSKGIIKNFDGFSFNDRDNRNVDVADGSITIGGGSGSGHENFGVWEQGKTVGLAKGTGLFADLIPPVFEGIMSYKNTGALYIHESSPRVLVQRVIAQSRAVKVARGGDRIGSVWLYRANGNEVYVHVMEHQIDPEKKKIPDVTLPILNGAFMPQTSVLAINYGSLADRIVSGFDLRPSNERNVDGEIFEAHIKDLRSMRKTMHVVGKTSPNSLGLIEHVRRGEWSWAS